MVHKARKWRLNIKVKEGLSLEASEITHVLELFILKAIEELKMHFERCTHVNGGEKIHAIEILIK